MGLVQRLLGIAGAHPAPNPGAICDADLSAIGSPSPRPVAHPDHDACSYANDCSCPSANCQANDCTCPSTNCWPIPAPDSHTIHSTQARTICFANACATGRADRRLANVSTIAVAIRLDERYGCRSAHF